jgi:hypothetical protein
MWWKLHPAKSFTTPLNPRRRPLGRRSRLEWEIFEPRSSSSRSDNSAARRISGQWPGIGGRSSRPHTPNTHPQSPRCTRPETHQNLIHSNKEQRHPTGRHPGVKPGGRQTARPRAGGISPRRTITPNSDIRDTWNSCQFSVARFQIRKIAQPPHALRSIQRACNRPLIWRRSGSNRRPPACKAGALPAELRPRSSGQGSLPWSGEPGPRPAADS